MKNLQTRIYADVTSEPVTLEEAKKYCKVTDTYDDTVFNFMIKAAREALEKYTNSSFAQKTIHATWVDLPDNWVLELPYGPHISVTAVYHIDDEGTETALTVNDDYYVYGDQDLILKFEPFWSSGVKVRRSVRVEYTAGYGHSSTEPLPDALKLAILKQVATDYLYRDNFIVGGISILDNSVKSIAAPYRKKLWF
jgi:uncharacterized phiE125 gp8 family phage protein